MPYRFSLVFLLLTATTAAAQQTIVRGELAPGDPTFPGRGLLDAYEIPVRRGDSVSITLRSRSFDGYLLVIDPGSWFASSTHDDQAWKGWTGAATVVRRATMNGSVYAFVTSEQAGLAGTERGPYELEITRPLPPNAPSDARALSRARALQILAVQQLQQTAYDSAKTPLQQARDWEAVAAAHAELGWQARRANALFYAGMSYAKDPAPASRQRAVKLAHELLPQFLQLNDTVLAGLTYKLLADAHTDIDSVIHYRERASQLELAQWNLSQTNQLAGDTTQGVLSRDDLTNGRGYLDLYEFSGQKGQRLHTNLVVHTPSGYALLVSPEGDTVDSRRTAGVIEHDLTIDGEWLIAVATDHPDTATYRLDVSFRDARHGIPDVRVVPRARAQHWLVGRTFLEQAEKLGAFPASYEAAARAFIRAGRLGEGALQLVVAGTMFMTSDQATGFARLREGAALARRSNSPAIVAAAEFSLGLAHHSANRVDSAFVYLEQAATRFAAAGRHDVEKKVRDQIATLRALEKTTDASGLLRGQLADDDVTWAGTERAFDAWTFQANQGDTLHITLSSNVYPTRVHLLSPSGYDTTAIAGASERSAVSSVAHETGWWLVIAESPDRARGDYAVEFRRQGRYLKPSEFQPVAHQQLREYATAVSLRDSALAAGQTAAAAALFKRAGDVFMKAYRNRQAFEAYLRARVAFGAAGRPDDAREMNTWLGTTVWNDSSFYEGRVFYGYFSGLDHAARGEYGNALTAYYQAFAVWGKAPGGIIWGWLRKSIGDTRAALGQHAQALASYQAARREFQQGKEERDVIYVTHGIGLMQMNLGRHEDALKNLRQSLAGVRQLADRASEGVVLRSIGELYARLAQTDSALSYNQRALSIQRELGNRTELASVFMGIGRAHQQLGRSDSALVYHREALHISRQVDNRFSIGRALQNIGRAYAHGNADLLRAAVYYDSASVVYSEVREQSGLEAERISMADQFVSLSNEWMRVWLARSDVATADRVVGALAVVERGRAQALIDKMRNERQRKLQPNTDLIAEGKQLVNSVRSNRTATLSYLLTADSLFAFLTTPSGGVSIERIAVADTTMTRHVAELRASLDVDSATVRNAGEELERNEVTETRPRLRLGAAHTALLQELSALVLPQALLAELPADIDLVIVPHGSLSLLPFTALPVGESILGVRNRIRYAPSLTALIEAEARPRAVTASNRTKALARALVVGNPEMPEVYNAEFEKQKLKPLPGAEAEGRAIAQRLKAEFLSGTDANEHEVLLRMRAAPVIHLATHGFAYGSEQRARDSFVALAPTADKDGLLTVGEVLTDPYLMLNAELVVLSACQTGLGNRKVAEGTVGLQWAFLARGARTVLVSLWSVSDAVTNQLMNSFYTHWTAGASKAEALQRAQEEIRETHPNPRYWAAFQLVGAN